MQQIEITEIFHSIQGESTYSGLPCVFVRLSGCNLRCSYCDTTYSHEKGQAMSIGSVIEKVKSFGCRLVELTGGEPLLQEGTPGLVSRLLSEGFDVLIETNGSIDIGLVDKKSVKIMDIKCPSSGMSDKNDFANIKRLTMRDQLKFVVSDKADFRYMESVIREHSPELSFGSILVSPVTEKLRPDELAAWIIESGLEVRMQLQLHRQIWPDIDRGV